MMTLLGTLVNKPTLNADALAIKREGSTEKIEVKQGEDAIRVDLTKTLLFTMLPTMMTSNGADNNNNMMMMLMMVLLLDKDKNKPGSSSNDNTLLLMIPMMMMMNKK